MSLRVFLYLYTIALSSSDITKIHYQMTEDEFRIIFRTSHDKVPQYEVVPIAHSIQKRSVDTTEVIKLRAFEKNIELYLNPTNVSLAGAHTPVWAVYPDSMALKGLNYLKIHDAFRDVGVPYQDISSESAVILRKNKYGILQLHGNIHSDYVIHPLPYRLSNHLLRRRRSLNIVSPHYLEKDYHIIYRKPESKQKNDNGIRVVNRDRVHLNKLNNSRHKRDIPQTIFPELLIIMDYSLYEAVGFNFHAAIQYLLSFWNAVDLRYRLILKPEIRLHIATFIVSIKKGGTPYLENYRRGGNELDADKALEAMSKYYFHEARFPFKSYDMAVALTNLDMCNMVENYLCDTSTLGYAYEAGACNRSSIDRNTEAVGIVEDNGGYSAILPAAHEIGHLLGSSHDGLIETSNCPGYEGYIMTPAVTFGENTFYWSSCTRKAFDEFFRSEDANCLFNIPQQDKQLQRALPGKLKTLDEQCEKVYGTRACNYDASVCIKLECYVPKGGGYCKAVAAAAEGSQCGKGMHCIRGQCVVENTISKWVPSTTKKPTFPYNINKVKNS